MSNMFCFQCEQTSGCKACTRQTGVCGKTARTAGIQDRLIGSLIGLAASADGHLPNAAADHALLEGLFTTLTNVNFNDETIEQQIAATDALWEHETYDVNNIWNADEDIRSLKSLILFGMKGIAAYAYHAWMLGQENRTVYDYLYRGLRALGENPDQNSLLSLVMEAGAVNLTCMEMLDQANTGAYGIPTPTPVSLKVEKGPFIVITGHDLKDLELLLEQTRDRGINIYTHGEMLPAHGYPAFQKYPHLKGHYGTAWQNQQKEFDSLPAPILYTTNCLMPVKDSYADRVFTTEVVSYPGMVHIGPEKDFTPVIEKALQLGGFVEDRQFTGANGGTQMTTGFSHGAVLSLAGPIIDAVNSGAVRRFFLVGGCDGYHPNRDYFREFVQKTPADTLILTLACGKFRFNDLDLGSIGNFPRIMDMGQCNDAYGAVKVALALADAFHCGVNELPLTLVLSWYEQKAVAILLTLLHLGIKNIYIGPTLPAFISSNVLNYLVEQFHLTPVSTPEEDLKKIMG